MSRLNVQAIFNSIDGEVNGFYGAGELCTFIRLKGCNLDCRWCFGVKLGRKIPKIITSKGRNKQLPDVKIGDFLLTYTNTFEKVETQVVDAHCREVDSWYELQINNTLYYVTEEHPFYTTRGIVQAKNLKVNDKILHSGYQEKLSFTKMGERNPMKNPETALKSSKNTDYVESGKKVSQTIRKKQELGTYISSWNLLSEKDKKQMRKKISTANSGSGNGNWRGGSKTPNHDFLSKMCKLGVLEICKLCNRKKVLEVHHLNGNIKDDILENLTTICHSCHSKIHKRGYNFWLGERKDKKILSIQPDYQMLQMNGYLVQKIKYVDRFNYSPSIRPKPLKVYNLTCSPYNSYLIDYMWVHNCDTRYAQNSKPENWMTIDEILNCWQIHNHHYPKLLDKITITGGEPLLQRTNLLYLVDTLLTNGHRITIETNGTKPPLAEIDTSFHHLRYVVDYKLPSSGMEHYMLEEVFDSLSERDIIKFVITNHFDYYIARDLVAHKDWAARKVFSPVITNDSYHKNWPAELAEMMLDDYEVLQEVQFSLQLHKILWPDAKEER